MGVSEAVAGRAGSEAAGVELVVLSLSAPHPEGRDGDYLRWHLLDHLPEQYTIPELRTGIRWRASHTPASEALPAAPPFEATEHAVAYFFASRGPSVTKRFFALGQHLHDAGRMPLRLPKVHLGSFTVARTATSASTPVSPGVLPFCPFPATFLLVERSDSASPTRTGDLLAQPGVAGVWVLDGVDLSPPGAGTGRDGGSATMKPWFDASGGLRAMLLFLADPDRATPAIAARLAHRAGPGAGPAVVMARTMTAVREPPSA